MYDIFEQLLQKCGVSSYKVSKDTGVTQTSLSNWKSGKSTPSVRSLIKIAEYFSVSLEYLTTGIEKEGGETYYLNDETKKIAQEIFENKNLQMLFDVARNASPKRLKAYYDMIKQIEEPEGGK